MNEPLHIQLKIKDHRLFILERFSQNLEYLSPIETIRALILAQKDNLITLEEYTFLIYVLACQSLPYMQDEAAESEGV